MLQCDAAQVPLAGDHDCSVICMRPKTFFHQHNQRSASNTRYTLRAIVLAVAVATQIALGSHFAMGLTWAQWAVTFLQYIPAAGRSIEDVGHHGQPSCDSFQRPGLVGT